MDWPDGAKYIGEWKLGKAEGKGTFLHKEGDKFEGYWANDKANGFGRYDHNNGAVY